MKSTGFDSFIKAFSDAVSAIPEQMPDTRTALAAVARGMEKESERFNEHMDKIQKELIRGCRRTKGDIV